MPKLNSLEVVHQDTNKDPYDNLHDLLVSLKVSANKEIIDNQARAAYETLLEMYVNDKEAFNHRLETITAEFGTSIAQVLEEWTVYASATEAYAKKIDEVSAKAFQNEAKVTEEMYARVTADEAVAKLVTTLRADFESAQTRSRASIREEQIARANATEALASRSSIMEAAIAANNAMILEEQLVRANADEAFASDLATLSATAGSKNRTYYQTTAPTTEMVSGDLWIDLDDNKLYRYNGSSWVDIQDNQIGVNTAAITEEADIRAGADGALAIDINAVTARLDTGDFATVKTQAEAGALKNKTYRQPSEPTNSPVGTLQLGDLWFDTDNNNKLYRWNGLVWSESSDTYNLNDFITNTYTPDYAAIESQVDAKAETWFQTTDPSTAWTTQAVRDLHDKDLWYNSSTKLLKIYVASSNTWTTVQDQAAINAAAAASAAQETADGKIVTFVQSTTPTAEGIGDLWMDTANNRQMKRWNGTSWVAVDDTRIASTYARWGVQVDANGNVAGIQLNSNSSGSSEFTVVANNFKVYGSGGQESIQNPLDVTVAGSTQRVGIGNAMIVYYEGTNINRWAAINNIKTSGIYSRPTAPAIVDLPYSWASNGSAGFFVGNAGTGGNYHGLRGGVFNNNSDASTLSRGIVGSHTGSAFFAEVGGYAPFTGEHQSVVNKGYEIQEGQIVVDKDIVMKKDISNTLSRVEKSNTVNQKGVIGVFTRNNGPMSKIDTLAVISEHRVDDGFGNLTGPLTEQYDQIKDLYDVVSINALGEGQILVCGENGNISTGDLIVTSSVEGVGMKQSDDVIRSYTVAKARENITFEDSTTPKLVSCIYLCG